MTPAPQTNPVADLATKWRTQAGEVDRIVSETPPGTIKHETASIAGKVNRHHADELEAALSALTAAPREVAYARVHDKAKPHFHDVVPADSQEAEMWAYDLIPLYTHAAAAPLPREGGTVLPPGFTTGNLRTDPAPVAPVAEGDTVAVPRAWLRDVVNGALCIDDADAFIAREFAAPVAPVAEGWVREVEGLVGFVSEMRDLLMFHTDGQCPESDRKTLAARCDSVLTKWSPAHIAALAAPTPPAAEPVGEWNDEAAWALAKRAEAAGAERDSDDNGTWWTLRIEHFNAMLAAAPASPPGVDFKIGERVVWRSWYGTEFPGTITAINPGTSYDARLDNGTDANRFTADRFRRPAASEGDSHEG
jgi:hypothetical protein